MAIDERREDRRRVTIALLPFETSGLEGDLERLGDAIPEAMARVLTGVPFFEVASLTSSFAFRTDVGDLSRIGEALSVRYVVQGAIRAHRGRGRLSVRLGDCFTGREVWSETTTRDLDDPFAVEDEVSVEFALGLEARLVGVITLRDFAGVSDLDLYREFNQGIEAYVRFRRGTNRLARTHLSRALEIKPDSPQVLAYLAYTYATDAHFGWSADREASLRLAAETADRALQLDPKSPDALIVRGHVHMLAGDYEAAISVTDEGVKLDPTFGVGLHIQAMNMLYAGRYREAAALERHALDIAPFDALTDNSRAILATALVHIGRHGDAIAVADACLIRNPNWLVARVARAAALSSIGHEDAARDEAVRILGINERFSLEWWESVNPYRTREDFVQQIIAPLRSIGLPDRSGESSLEPVQFPEPDGDVFTGRWLVTVLLSDVVNSTGIAGDLGDRAWSLKLDEHNRRAARAVQSHDGRIVKMTGDGVLAIFDGPSKALGAAQEMRAAVAELGLEIRSGVHTGEIEVGVDDVSGLGVHIAARVSSLARAGEVLVTATVKDLVFGAGLSFSPQGRSELRGIPGTWELFSLDG